MKQSRKVLAITGSIGSGKSFAGKFFKNKGLQVIDADKVAKSLYKKGSSILLELSENFGSEILDSGGELNKEVLAGIVFKDKDSLAKLNGIVKNYLREEIDRIIDSYSDEQRRPFVVLEAPVLYEYGFENYADCVLLITAKEDRIMKRVMARDGVGADEVKARLSSQISQEEKIKLADLNLDNSGTEEDFETALEHLYPKILERLL